MPSPSSERLTFLRHIVVSIIVTRLHTAETMGL